MAKPSKKKFLKEQRVELGSQEQKQEALKNALGKIEERFGQGAIMRFGEQKTVEIDAIPTGSVALDMALGIGGIPRGRITEIYGPESSGKTTLTLHIIAEAQKMGGIAAFIDAEHALDPVYAKKIGVDIDNLLVSQPDNGEQALEICDALVRSGAVDLVVVDSVAALTPRAEIEGEMGESHVGLLARLMSQALRKLTGSVGLNNTALVFINQIREKIGVIYGSPETTPGGRALKFATSVRMDIRRGEAIKKGEEEYGRRTKVRVVKNKVAPPFKVVEFDIIYGEGISKESGIIDIAVDLGIINKSGSWYSYNGNRLAQGKEKVRIFLQENPEIKDEIEMAIRDADQALKNEFLLSGSSDSEELSEQNEGIIDEDEALLGDLAAFDDEENNE